MKTSRQFDIILRCNSEEIVATVISAIAPTQGVFLHAVTPVENTDAGPIRTLATRHRRVNGVTSDLKVLTWMKTTRDGRASRQEILRFLVNEGYKETTMFPTISRLMREGKIREVSRHHYETLEPQDD